MKIMPKYTIRALTVLFLVAALTACNFMPKKQAFELRITSSADVNPDIESRPSPIVLHVLQLTDEVAFDQANYFELTRNDATALGADAISKTEVVLAPGDARELTLELSPLTAYLGFVAGYRDIDNAVWRVAQPVKPGKTDWISINLARQSITIVEVND